MSERGRRACVTWDMADGFQALTPGASTPAARDPLSALDPIYQSITDPRARERLVATYDHDLSEHEWLLGYRWDIVLTGSHRTPLDAA